VAAAVAAGLPDGITLDDGDPVLMFGPHGGSDIGFDEATGRFTMMWYDERNEDFDSLQAMADAAKAAWEKTRAAPGTVSHGTLRPEDLIPHFAETLEDFASEAYAVEVKADEHIELARKVKGLILDRMSPEGIEETLTDLFEALDTYAPAGHTFGAHEGDGSDFGYWLATAGLDDDWEPEPTQPEPERPYVSVVVKGTEEQAVWAATARNIPFEFRNTTGHGEAVGHVPVEHLLAVMRWLGESGTAPYPVGTCLLFSHHEAKEGEPVAGWEEREAMAAYPVESLPTEAEERARYAREIGEEKPAATVDRGLTVWEAMTLPKEERTKIGQALAAGNVVFRS
jgi:hypothetical protein